MDIDKVYLGDCLELFNQVEDKSVDVCLTSPPYNDRGWDNPNTTLFHKKYIDAESHHNDWLEWQIQVIDNMVRCSRKCVIYNVQGLFYNRENVYKLIGHYANRIQDILIWHKMSAQPSSTPNAISNYYEMVLLIKPDGVDRIKPNSSFYKNVIVTNSITKNAYSDVHKAVMNDDFCIELIREFTSPGDVVLDPFFGTGTTGEHCIMQDRHFIGFEICESYYDLSSKRMSSCMNKRKSRLF